MEEGRRLESKDYTVGWISALAIELAAGTAGLDEKHSLPKDFCADKNDKNLYTFGRIGAHNVVIACMNAGQYGTVSAAWTAAHLAHKFPSLRFGLLVGIGGGVPSKTADIRLGDVVISLPQGAWGGVVQYDMGKRVFGGAVLRTGHLNSPPPLLLNAVAEVRAREVVGQSPVSKHLSVFDLLPESPFSLEKAESDILYDGETPIPRAQRRSKDPACHYGIIASGNMVIKDSATRDRISNELGGVLCFEMEAAGLMNNFPCLVIRGICDYSDSHKSKGWQPYAAAVAAAYAKELLSIVPGSNADNLVEDSKNVAKLNDPRIISPFPQQTAAEVENPRSADISLIRGLRDKNVQGKTAGSGDPQCRYIDTVPNSLHFIETGTASDKEKEKAAPTDRQPNPTMTLDPPQKPLYQKATFVLFDRSIHFYSQVYIGNGVVMTSVLNNQGGSINSGGAMHLGNVAGPISSRNAPGSRKFATTAFRPNPNRRAELPRHSSRLFRLFSRRLR